MMLNEHRSHKLPRNLKPKTLHSLQVVEAPLQNVPAFLRVVMQDASDIIGYSSENAEGKFFGMTSVFKQMHHARTPNHYEEGE